VGKQPNQKSFTAYHDLLTQRSEFFRAARSEPWSQDPSKPTILDDVEVEVFSSYLHCVNWGTEFLASLLQPLEDLYSTAGDETTDYGSEFKNEPAEKLLIDIYLLADRMMDPITANLVIDKLIDIVELRSQYFSVELAQFLYDSTTEGSPLRQFTLDWHVDGDPNKYLAIYIKDKTFPSDFLRDLLLAVFTINRDNQKKSICEAYNYGSLDRDCYHQTVTSDAAEAASASKQE
jgi:hypothetical protein